MTRPWVSSGLIDAHLYRYFYRNTMKREAHRLRAHVSEQISPSAPKTPGINKISPAMWFMLEITFLLPSRLTVVRCTVDSFLRR